MLCLCFLIPWSHPSCLFAAGIFMYGVAHYDPPETHSKITAPTRPDVVFENAGAVAEDDADVLPLLLEDSGL